MKRRKEKLRSHITCEPIFHGPIQAKINELGEWIRSKHRFNGSTFIWTEVVTFDALGCSRNHATEEEWCGVHIHLQKVANSDL